MSLPLILAGMLLMYFSIFQFLEDTKEELSNLKSRFEKFTGRGNQEEEEEDEDRILPSHMLRTEKHIKAMENAVYEEVRHA